MRLACESLTLERPGGDPGPKPPRVQKAELRELDERLRDEINKDRWVQVQLNPRDLRLSRSQADGEAQARLALELWFDATGEGDVRRLTERVGYFATPRPAQDRKPPGQPGVRFAWGGFRFDGHVEALEETLDVFSADGRPQRARLTLSLRGAT